MFMATRTNKLIIVFVGWYNQIVLPIAILNVQRLSWWEVIMYIKICYYYIQTKGYGRREDRNDSRFIY